MTIAAPRGKRLVRTTVEVRGRRVAIVRGRRTSAVVDLRGLPRGAFVLRVRATTSDGRTRTTTRRYRTCVAR